MLATLGCAMMLPAILDLAYGNQDWTVFAAAATLTLFVGVGLAFAARGQADQISIRSTFVLTVLLWVLLAGFGALPFVWSELQLSPTDAFFEAMSGLTTTGSTVIVGLDTAPPGLLLWRGLLQWLGGLGIIVMAIAVFPMLQVGGMQLFKVEAFETQEKILPKATQISSSLTLIYIALTIANAVGYYIAGMGTFDAVVHAMTTVATGGFANYDASLGYFDSTAVESIAIVFMMLGSLPFLLYIKMMQGHRLALVRDSQVKMFVALLAAFTVLALISQSQTGANIEHGLREAAFNVVSIMTGTGYSTVDYDNWGQMAVIIFFMLAFIGGCAGSTSCGIKVFRFQVLHQNMKQHLRRALYPNGIFVNRYNGAPIPDHVSAAVLSFFFLFFVSFGVLAGILSLTGLDPLTALSAAGTAIANVGPGLGSTVGPAGNFSTLPDTAKWALSAGMLLGRLELFTVLLLLTPAFWRA
jgi:trk system potassium uptake protein TrkH